MIKRQTQKMLISAVVFILFFQINNLSAQDYSPSMKAWDNLLNKPQLAEFFTDIFDNLGIILDESNEKFTVHHKGNHFELSKGVDKSKVDYVVYLKSENIANMAKHGSDSVITSQETYKIMSVLFTPLTQASLQSPMMKKPLLRKLAGIENLIHVYLVNPDKTEITSHTLIFINKQWIVTNGIYGKAKRTFKLSPEQAVQYQKHVFRAIKTNKAKEWKKFKKWYKKWRKEVSVEV